jgi:GTP-dependent phosphoenolpyruvate carboxykinase
LRRQIFGAAGALRVQVALGKSEIKHDFGRLSVDFLASRRDHHYMPHVMNRDAFFWLIGALIGAALAASVDAATVNELGRLSYHVLAEPYTRLAYFGAFCG